MKTDLLSKYAVMVDFLAEVLGTDHEIVLHDITNLDHSIIAIRNNHVSEREIGGPATDLVLKTLKNSEDSEKPFICNYKGVSKNGKQIRSSTFFIRNEEGKIIGMLCINSDTTAFAKFIDAFQGIAAYANLPDFGTEEMHISENLSSSIEELTLKSIESIISGQSISPERMKPEEKIEIVSELNKLGVFLLKGAVSEVAKNLKSSEATIYRYLQKVK